VEFLVPTPAPVPSITVLALSNVAQVANSETTNLVVNALPNDVFGEGM
jgi:hypothetical protein